MSEKKIHLRAVSAPNTEFVATFSRLTADQANKIIEFAESIGVFECGLNCKEPACAQSSATE